MIPLLKAHRILLLAKALVALLLATSATVLFPLIWLPDDAINDWQTVFLHDWNDDPITDPVIVEIRDDAAHRARLSSLQPTDRGYVADLAGCIAQGQPAAIGIDVLLADDNSVERPQGTLIAALGAVTEKTPVVLANFDVIEVTGYSFAYPPIEALADAAGAGQGNVRLLRDKRSERVRFTLPVAPDDPIERTFADAVLVAGGYETRSDRSERQRIAWFHPEKFQRLNSIAIMQICEAEAEGLKNELSRLFFSKLVLIGSTAQRDLHRTPLSTLDAYQEGIPGVMVHANIIKQALDGPQIWELGWIWRLLLGLIFSIMAIVIAAKQWVSLANYFLVPAAIFVIDAVLFMAVRISVPSGFLSLCYIISMFVWHELPELRAKWRSGREAR